MVRPFHRRYGGKYDLLLSTPWMKRVRAVEDHGNAALNVEGKDEAKRSVTAELNWYIGTSVFFPLSASAGHDSWPGRHASSYRGPSTDVVWAWESSSAGVASISLIQASSRPLAPALQCPKHKISTSMRPCEYHLSKVYESNILIRYCNLVRQSI